MNNIAKIDILNTLLIVVSLILAYIIPFELFVMAYAILGPLHYITEINWIRDRNYFLNAKSWLWIIIVFGFALLIALPTIFNLEIFSGFNNVIVQLIQEELPKYTNAFIFLALVLAYVFLFIKIKKLQYVVIVLAIISAIFLNSLNAYNLWVGIFLPTIIHVYLFTLLFMWYGSLKANARLGKFNVVLIALVPFIIAMLSVDFITYHFSDEIKNIIIENRFHVLNANLSHLLGLSDGTTFFFYEKIDLKIQIFIAFAYLYHYLNWFSKTTIIGWHKQLTKKKSIIIFVLWILSISLYLYDYKVGLAMLLVLSLAHVFAEFPLNFISIKGIFRALKN